MMSIRRVSTVSLLVAVLAGCHSGQPAVVLPPPPLSDSAAAALRWVEGHAVTLEPVDSVTPTAVPQAFFAFVGNARVLGVSELTEGTHQFALRMRDLLASLASRGFRGIAIQAPMAETMELDRYVRSGTGNPRQWLRTLGPHWNT